MDGKERRLGARNVPGGPMSNHQPRDPIDRLDRVMHTGITRLMWIWSLGIVWLTILIAGVLLWTR
jgi:hypothetical protein